MIPGLIVFLAAHLAVASEVYIDLGDTKQKVLAVEGRPTSSTEMRDHNGVFLNLYYADKNIRYVIDVKKNSVCEIGADNEPGTCYPCVGKSGEDLCI